MTRRTATTTTRQECPYSLDRDRDNRDSRDRDSKVLAGVLAMIRAQDVPVEEHKVLPLAVEELPPELVIDPRYTACVSQSTRAMDNTKRKVIKCVLQE